MSNQQLTWATIVVLALHLAALAAAVLLKRGPAPAAALNLAVAVVALGYLATHPRWLAAPVDWQLAAVAGFEALALAGAVLALKRVSLGVAGSWVVFGVHFLASGAAVAFALLFRITRLI